MAGCFIRILRYARALLIKCCEPRACFSVIVFACLAILVRCNPEALIGAIATLVGQAAVEASRRLAFVACSVKQHPGKRVTVRDRCTRRVQSSESDTTG